MIKITGLDEFTKSLDDIAARAKELANATSVPIADVLTPSFLEEHTKFTSLEHIFASGGFNVQTAEDLEAIPDEQMDAHVRTNSAFATWSEMLGQASSEWAARKLMPDT